MTEDKFKIQFLTQKNQTISNLVNICYSNLKASNKETIIAKPVEDAIQSQYPSYDEQIDYAETDEDVSGINSQILAYPFSQTKRVIKNLVIAVDSGVIPLGYLVGGGAAFALRGSAVVYDGDGKKGILMVLLYNSGTLVVNNDNKALIFRYLGERLGKPDLYVRKVDGKLIPNPSSVDTPNQIRDRCRSFLERIIQEEAIGILSANDGGILLIDGALAYSFDTPREYLDKMLKSCRDKKIDVCAISKRSRITIGGIPIDSIFDAHPSFVGYAPLMKVLEKERSRLDELKMRSAGDLTAGTEIFAARFGFGPPGLTFRVDVSKTFGSSDADVINDVYSKCLITGGYPKPLIDAHHYSTFLSGDVLNLQADLVARTGYKIKEEPSMGVLFQPFGAFGK
ncbi:MAG: DNA double-strand break repair nuclease NurA [Anaerolineales bacterium]|nr:MAG: DNA double-strand break repair nuclease NurA [Anaerolineales bacterium]